jgi:Lon protease-like protein
LRIGSLTPILSAVQRRIFHTMETRTLPQFPLPLVLFPGASQALHIFEPRYRQLVADCQAGDGQFGITPVSDGSGSTPAIGSVGCTAMLRSVVPLPDGRSNIVVAGDTRYAIADYVDADRLYLVAEIVPIEDEGEGDAPELLTLAAELRRQFDGYREVARKLPDSPDLPEPPKEPGALSFAIAGALPLDLRAKVQLLELRSTIDRLRRLREVLEQATELTAAQVRLQKRARRNGRRPLASGGTV